MPWQPLPRIAFGICTYPFQPSSPADLPLEIGDELYIIEQGGKDGSWYRGYLVAPPSLLAGLTSVKGQTLEARVFSGIFPRVCVEIREVLGDERSRAGTAEQSRHASMKQAMRDIHAEQNGVLTPNGSESPSPPPGLRASMRYSRAGIFGEAPAIPVMKSMKPDTLRLTSLTNHMSRHTLRSEEDLRSMLPLSPLSIADRDPNAPRPTAPVPMLKIGDETPASAQEPLVDEIASCLREWHSTKLHELLLSRRYSQLDKMADIVQRLDTSRRQLLHKVLTDQELGILRERTVWDLVNGNKMLCDEVIVRNPNERGRIMTGDDSAIEVTKLQSMMSLLKEKPLPPPDEHVSRHLMISIPYALGELSSPKTIAIHLCSKAPGQPLRPVSEVHAINVSAMTGAAPEGKMKTLFVDLGAADMGEGAGAGSTLHLAFKVIVTEPLRSPVVHSIPGRDSMSSASGSGYDMAKHSGSSKGRRGSVMWSSQRPRKESNGAKDRISEERPDTMERGSMTTEIPPQASGGRSDSSSSGRPQTRDAKYVKRTVAAGIIRVDQILKQGLELEQDVALWTPSSAPSDEKPEADGTWDTLMTEILTSPSGEYRKYPFPKPLRVFAKSFSDPDAGSLIRMTPTLLQNISQTRRIGFSGAPSKSRSDIYLTLTEPFLPRHAFLAHPKSGTVPLGTQQGLANLQLTLEVRRSTGQRIENCIFPSCNSQGHTAWRTTAAERGEPWNLTIRLAISPEDVPGSHIVMSIADLPGFPFALCWMPLWNDGAFIQDGDHSLTLYQYDEYTSSIISGRGAYLALPWGVRKKEEPAHGPIAALQLRTYLCSTKYSQDPHLLGLLNWQIQPAGTLPSLLRSFAFVPEIEIVKLLDETFDALFEILVDAAGSEEYENLVFNNLVFVLGIVHDRRFKLAPLVDQYVDSRFKYPAATACLMRSFMRMLANPTDPETSRKLRATFKVGAHIFKFISVGRAQQEARTQIVGLKSKPTFLREIKAIFVALHDLVKNPAPILIGTKTLVVQHFHTWLPELIGTMTPEDILRTVIEFVDACANVSGKLVLYKLVMIEHLFHLDALKVPEMKRQLRTSTLHWLEPYWGQTEIVNEQWKDQVRLCCSVVASQINELGEEGCEHIPKLVDSYRAIQAAPRQAKRQLSLLFPNSYPFQSRQLSESTSDFDEPLIEIAAVLAAITSLPSNLHFDMPRDELAEFLFSALQVYISILDTEAYPSNWLSVNIYHHKSTMRSLEKLSGILVDSFLPHPGEADQFNTELWRAFFDALLKLVGSEALALETFPEQKRRAVWKIAGDVRELGADLLRRSWEAIGWETSEEDRIQYGLEKLGGYQVQYVPGLVGSIVELCLSVHEGLRGVAIGVLQTMIISEWTLSQDLSLIQAEIIDCLDQLFTQKAHSESVSQKLFIGELIDLFEPLAREPDDRLFAGIKSLVATVDELLDLLVAVHSTERSGEAFHIMDTLQLMDFLKDMQKEDMFIRYVHQLAQLQADAWNFTEAGLALRLHADLYEWDPATIAENLKEPYFPTQTAFERKEQLYFQMIKYYEDGQSWDNALGSYMELADQYEHNIFDFAKLARAQRAMATIYDAISRGQRENPRYFRVVYKGFGFRPSLRDKEFIFQGLSTDRMASFTDRLQRQHPSASIHTSGSTEDDVEGQFIHVYPVSPQKDLMHPIYQRSKVSTAVRDYYLLSRPNSFTATTRRKNSEGGRKEQTVEKTVYKTADAFPTILRRSEIISVGKITLAPLQIAIERTTRKTAELYSLDKKILDGEDTAFSQLTDALMLAIDLDSSTSVAHYRQLYERTKETANSDTEDSDEEQEETPLTPLENALKTALIDYAMAIKRCLSHYSRPAHQATRADLLQRFELTFSPEAMTFATTDAQTNPNRPSSINSWLANTTIPPASSPAPMQSLQVNSLSPQTSTSEKQHNRLSLNFLKRGPSVNAGHQESLRQQATTEMEQEKENVRPTTNGENNGNATYGNSNTQTQEQERVQSPTNLSTRSEDKLQKYFGIPQGQYRVISPTADDMATTTVSGENIYSAADELERPITRQSGVSAEMSHDGLEKANSTAQSPGRRRGSVKKRLSLLGIGKKSSNSSARTRGQIENPIEE